MATKKFTIGIVGLSYPIKDNLEGERAARSFIQKLQSEGHTTIVGKTVFSKFGYKTASIQDRLSDLHQMFANPDIEIILNNTGGYSSNELLEFIDYNLIQKNPKIFVGFSDITAVNLALYSKAKIQTIDGHTIDDFEIEPDFFEKIISTTSSKNMELKNYSTYKDAWTKKNFPSPKILTLKNKKVTANGKIVAGNLSTFNLLLGVPYLPNFTNKILFLEHNKAEIQDLPALERMLWQIRQNGIFDKINGLVFGLLEPEVQKEETEFQNIQNILETVTQNYTFPVLYNAQFGHIYPSWVLQNGRKVEIINNQIFLK